MQTRTRQNRLASLGTLLLASLALAEPAGAVDVRASAFSGEISVDGALVALPSATTQMLMWKASDVLSGEFTLNATVELPGEELDFHARLELRAGLFGGATFVLGEVQVLAAEVGTRTPQNFIDKVIAIDFPAGFDAFAAQHQLLGEEFSFQVIVDSQDEVVEKELFAELNNLRLLDDVAPLNLAPVEGVHFGGTFSVPIVTLAGSIQPLCADPTVDLAVPPGTQAEWIPSANGQWAPIAFDVPGACLSFLSTGQAFRVLLPPKNVGNLTGPFGGATVELGPVVLGANGADLGDITIPLPPGHSIHVTAPNGTLVPEGEGELQQSAGGPYTDVDDLSLFTVFPSGVHLKAPFLSFSFTPISYTVDSAGVWFFVWSARSIHDLPYNGHDLRHHDAQGVIGNDRRFWRSTSTSLQLTDAGFDIDIPFQAEPGLTHFPLAVASWKAFDLQLEGSAIVPGQELPATDAYAMGQLKACPQCPAGGPLDVFVINPTVAQGLAPDGTVTALVSMAKNPRWGPFDDVESRHIFERLDDQGLAATYLVPGPIATGTGGDLFGEPLPVPLFLLGMRELDEQPSGVLQPTTHHGLLDPEAHAGNFVGAGITKGAYRLRSSLPQGPAQNGEGPAGELLTDTRMRIGLGGLPGPTYATILSNASTKYIQRRVLTGVFNTDAEDVPANPLIFGYAFDFRAFAFRVRQNEIDPYTWIDGTVEVPKPGEFSISFNSLQLLCSGQLEGGVVEREACDGIDNDDDDQTDENCDEVLAAWQTDFDIHGMTFVPAGQCEGNRELEIASTVYPRALDDPLGLTAIWQADGQANTERITGATHHVVDRPSGGTGFDLLLSSEMSLDWEMLPQGEGNGWFRMQGAQIPVGFWNSLEVAARLQNQDPGTATQTIVYPADDLLPSDPGAGSGGPPNPVLATEMSDPDSPTVTARYEWGATSFGFTQGVFFETGNLALSEPPRFIGRKKTKDLIVLDIESVIDFISPVDGTAISFGASADLGVQGIVENTLGINLSNPLSVENVDALLNQLGIQPANPIQSAIGGVSTGLLSNLADMNEALDSGTDDFIEAGLGGAIDAMDAQDPIFDDLADQLASARALPMLIVAGAIEPLLDLEAEFEQAFDPALDTRVTQIVDDAAALLYPVISGGPAPDPQDLQDLTLALDELADGLTPLAAQLSRLDVEIDDAIDLIEKVLPDSAEIADLADDAIANVEAMLPALGGTALVDGMGFVCGGTNNPIVTRIADIRDRVDAVHGALSAIDLGSLSNALGAFLGVDLQAVADVQDRIVDLVEDIDAQVNAAHAFASPLLDCDGPAPNDWNELAGVGAGSNELELFLEGIRGALTTLESDVDTLREEIAGDDGYLRSFEIPSGIGQVLDALAELRHLATVGAAGGSPGDLFDDIPNEAALQAWIDERLLDGGLPVTQVLASTLPAALGATTTNVLLGAANTLDGLSQGLPQPRSEELQAVIIDSFMNHDLIANRTLPDAYLAYTELGDFMNDASGRAVDLANQGIKALQASLEGAGAGALADATSQISDWSLISGDLTGYAEIHADELDLVQIDASFSLLDTPSRNAFEFFAGMTLERWSNSGKGAGCNVGLTAESLVDFSIYAGGLPFRLGPVGTEIRKLEIGFTLEDFAPVGAFGGIHLGDISVEVFELLHPTFMAGFGRYENYVGASAGAFFSGVAVELAFLGGQACDTTVLEELDPQVHAFLDFGVGDRFLGGYGRGAANLTVWNNGCALQVGVAGDVGNWAIHTGQNLNVGMLLGGGLYGQIGCVVSARGQFTLFGNITDQGLFSAQGKAFAVIGVGRCKAAKWTSIARSRDDDPWCFTVDAELGAEASANLAPTLQGSGVPEIDWSIDRGKVGAIH